MKMKGEAQNNLHSVETCCTPAISKVPSLSKGRSHTQGKYTRERGAARVQRLFPFQDASRPQNVQVWSQVCETMVSWARRSRKEDQGVNVVVDLLRVRSPCTKYYNYI